MTTERTNSKINNVTLLVISSESKISSWIRWKRDIPQILAEKNRAISGKQILKIFKIFAFELHLDCLLNAF